MSVALALCTTRPAQFVLPPAGFTASTFRSTDAATSP
jgi:hypothetical protein